MLATSKRVEIIIKGRMNGSLGRMRRLIGKGRGVIMPVNVSFFRPPPMGTSNSNYHEGPYKLNK